MARLAALEKMLYYPTDLETVGLLVDNHIRVSAYTISPTYIFDACAGEALAVKRFAEHFQTEAFNRTVSNGYWRDTLKACQKDVQIRAVELDAERAAAAKELLGKKNVLHAPFESVAVIGQFSILFLNPPYTYANGRRVELNWVEMTAPFLGYSGTLVLIVPDMFVNKGKHEREMRQTLIKSGYVDATVLRFPDSSYPQFKQVAILARKKQDEGKYTYNRIYDLDVKGVIGECDVTFSHQVKSVTAPTVTQAVKSEAKPSVFAAGFPKSLIDLVGDPTGKSNTMRPLAPMRSEHAAMVAAAGMLNGAVIDGKAIKGSTVKKLVEVSETVETAGGNEAIKTTSTEILAAQLATLDMETGTIDIVNSVDDKEKFEAMLEDNAQEFVDLAKRLYPPAFDETLLHQYAPALSRVHAPRKIGGRQNGLFPQQVFRAAAILDGWRRHKVITMVGEMGVGKTVVSMAACTVDVMRRKPHNQKIVVLLPPKQDLITKWEEEIKLALRDFYPHVVHAENISDVQKAFDHPGLVFILIKETTAKMSSGWAPVWPKVPRQPTKQQMMRPVKCPMCGQKLELTNEDPYKLKSACANPDCNTPMWTVTRRVSNRSKVKNKPQSTHVQVRVSVDDKEVLGEMIEPNDVAESEGWARYPLAKFIRDRYRDRYTLIIDEAHNFKAGDSARAYAAQDLLASCHRAVQMTGTLYNGMASSIYYLLWRSQPEFRSVWGWNDVQRFINQYGLFEVITRSYRDESSTSSSGYKGFSERKSEKPGIHPAMIALLLPSTVFFGIRDIEAILPAYSENTLFVNKPPEFHRIQTYLDIVKDDAVQQMMDKHNPSMSLLSQFTWAKQGAWDMAALGDWVDGHSFGPIDPPNEMWPKEEALLRLVAKEKRAGRKVLCFIGQINRRDVTGRLCELLKRYGMKGSVMRANEKSRVEFVRHALKKGADVIFTSASLVKEGIDLLELPTFVWYAGENNIFLVQQANRRAWRPGQTLDCDIYYLAYNETPQADTMHRTAKKLAAAQSIAGDVRQGLAAILGEEDFVSRLQDATISTVHFESDLSLDDLPALEAFAEQAEMSDVHVHVKVESFRPTRVHVEVEVVDLSGYSQLSLF